MEKYVGILFALGGDWVTDFGGNTKEEVIDQLADRGSIWYFYPFEGVIRNRTIINANHQRVVDMAEPLKHLTGKTIRTVSRHLENIPEGELAHMFKEATSE